jgi:hypothetical protein
MCVFFFNSVLLTDTQKSIFWSVNDIHPIPKVIFFSFLITSADISSLLIPEYKAGHQCAAVIFIFSFSALTF